MDITVYISELLYEHDCVVIPNFGGLVCSYQPAEIHPLLNTISPPSKAIAFNKNLQTNDGLLATYIARRYNVDFETALMHIANWVNTANNLLEAGEKVILHNIGELMLDIEKNIQFKPYTRFNYLKSSFALPVIQAVPVTHATEQKTEATKTVGIERSINRSSWKIAAAVFMLVALTAIMQLMRMGVQVKEFEIDEARFLNFIEWFSPVKEADETILPVHIESLSGTENAGAADDSVFAIKPTNETLEELQQNHEQGYYIIIGSFTNPANAEVALAKLQHSDSSYKLLKEKSGDFTKVGYWVAYDLAVAREQLSKAREENSTYWLYRKK